MVMIICQLAIICLILILSLVGRHSLHFFRLCHAHDNQLHPRLKDSPSRLVPLPSHLLQIAEITHASPLRNPYVIQHRLASPQPNPEHHKTSPERTQPHASNNRARPGSCSPHSPSRILAKVPCCITIFSPLSIYVYCCSRLGFTIIPFPPCTLVFTFYV